MFKHSNPYLGKTASKIQVMLGYLPTKSLIAVSSSCSGVPRCAASQEEGKVMSWQHFSKLPHSQILISILNLN